MATTSTLRKRATNTFGINRFKSAVAAIACTATLSTVGTLAPAMAQDAPTALDSLTSILKSNDPSVAQLASAIAKAQTEVASLESQIGEHREAVNRALVDLQDARTKAAQARKGAANAKNDLENIHKQIEAAQKRLDELSRTAYRRANTSEAVTNAAGGDARQTMLERSAYLRTQADDQQVVVDQLEKERTEKANKESELRKVQELADARAERAADAESAARQTLADSESQIQSITAQREALIAQQEAAQAKLDAARGGDSAPRSAQAQASRTSETAGQAATPQGRQSAPQAGAAQQAQSQAQPQSQSEQVNQGAGEGAQVQVSETVSNQGANPGAAAAGQDGTVTVDGQDAVGSSLDAAQQLLPVAEQASSQNPQGNAEGGSSQADINNGLALAGAAVGAAAAIVAAAQPEHAQLAEHASSLVNGLSALQGPSANAGTDPAADGLANVLDPLQNNDSVTSAAQDAVSNLDREQKIEAVIARAQSVIGTPYAWGGGDANGPTRGIRDGGVADSFGDYNKVGFDCSGLTLYAFAAAGISLPHYTGYQYNHGTKVSTSEMKRGDLIFYGPGGSQHVAIYLGDGMMIEAPQSGQTVRETPVRWSGMSPYAVRLI